MSWGLECWTGARDAYDEEDGEVQPDEIVITILSVELGGYIGKSVSVSYCGASLSTEVMTYRDLYNDE